MDVFANPHAWAQHHFADAQLGDQRRTRRLVQAAADIAAHPEKPFTQVFDWNDLRGFYRLCDEQDVSHQAILQPHCQRTRQALAEQALVLILHDTTELDFTSHPALQGVGPIGDGNGQGFLQHNSLAVVPQPRQVIGLTHQQLWIRPPKTPRQSSYQRKQRRRESQRWIEGITAAGPAPPDRCWVDVADRGGDIYEAMQTARALGHHFLFRICQDRLVQVGTASSGRSTHLMAYARDLPVQGTDSVDIPGRGGRPARTAQVSLAAAAVWVPAPMGTRQRWSQPLVPAWVIRVWEAEPPAAVSEPLEWVLLCSLPSDGIEAIRRHRDWYSCRWMAEVYHDIEKNGCSEEARRFERADRMEACLAVLSVVAVRVFQLRCALSCQADEPADQVATVEERQLIRRFIGVKKRVLTVRDFVRGVAKLGGFLGRKCDGEPGVRSLWRGYQRLQDMLLGIHLHAP
jgi:Transposase DNA-binding/Transposase Tn5 dimerisation domain